MREEKSKMGRIEERTRKGKSLKHLQSVEINTCIERHISKCRNNILKITEEYYVNLYVFKIKIIPIVSLVDIKDIPEVTNVCTLKCKTQKSIR